MTLPYEVRDRILRHYLADVDNPANGHNAIFSVSSRLREEAFLAAYRVTGAFYYGQQQFMNNGQADRK